MDLKTALVIHKEFDRRISACVNQPEEWSKITLDPEFLEIRKYLTKNDPVRWAVNDYHGIYLRSDFWKKKIKPRILKRDKNMCQRCGQRATEVHHRSYDNEVMRGNNDKMLVSLCRKCHTFISRDENGKKRTELEQERLLHTAAEPSPPRILAAPLESKEIPPIIIKKGFKSSDCPHDKRVRVKAALYPKNCFCSLDQELRWLEAVSAAGLEYVRHGIGWYVRLQWHLDMVKSRLANSSN